MSIFSSLASAVTESVSKLTTARQNDDSGFTNAMRWIGSSLNPFDKPIQSSEINIPSVTPRPETVKATIKTVVDNPYSTATIATPGVVSGSVSKIPTTAKVVGGVITLAGVGAGLASDKVASFEINAVSSVTPENILGASYGVTKGLASYESKNYSSLPTNASFPEKVVAVSTDVQNYSKNLVSAAEDHPYTLAALGFTTGLATATFANQATNNILLRKNNELMSDANKNFSSESDAPPKTGNTPTPQQTPQVQPSPPPPAVSTTSAPNPSTVTPVPVPTEKIPKAPHKHRRSIPSGMEKVDISLRVKASERKGYIFKHYR